MMSLAKPLLGSRLAFMPSVNIAGSRLEAPYTAALDFTTSLRTSGACWHAARSCIVPMTLSSFIEVLPPDSGSRGRADAGVHDRVDPLAHDHLRDDRVADVGAHEVGLAEVTPRRHHVDADDALDPRRPRELRREATPEIAGNAGDENDLAHGGGGSGLLAEAATLHARLLQQLAVLLLRHALATLLDDRTHV